MIILRQANDRKQAVEMVIEDRDRLQQENQRLESKNLALKSRIHNLESDAQRYKEQMKVILEKSSTDDQLIDGLRSEIEKLKQQIKTKAAAAAAAAASSSVAGAGRLNYASSMNGNGSGGIGTGVGAGAGAVVMVSNMGSTPVAVRASLMPGPDLAIEVQRLKRLCKQQLDQLNTQEEIIKELRSSSGGGEVRGGDGGGGRRK
jgi:hypothetical protein